MRANTVLVSGKYQYRQVYRDQIGSEKMWTGVSLRSGSQFQSNAGRTRSCIRYPPTHPTPVPRPPHHCSGLQLCRQSSEATAAGQTRGGGEKECAGEHKHWPVGGLAGPSICFQLGPEEWAVPFWQRQGRPSLGQTERRPL